MLRWPKSPPLMTSLTKKPATPKQKFFFECRLEDLPCFLSLWTALYNFRHPSYAHAKPHAIWLFWCENPRILPDVKVLSSSCEMRNEVCNCTCWIIFRTYKLIQWASVEHLLVTSSLCWLACVWSWLQFHHMVIYHD